MIRLRLYSTFSIYFEVHTLFQAQFESLVVSLWDLPWRPSTVVSSCVWLCPSLRGGEGASMHVYIIIFKLSTCSLSLLTFQWKICIYIKNLHLSDVTRFFFLFLIFFTSGWHRYCIIWKRRDGFAIFLLIPYFSLLVLSLTCNFYPKTC